MSADNEIMIAEFLDGFRVAELQAAEESLEPSPWTPDHEIRAYIRLWFRESPVFRNHIAAATYAEELSEKTSTEYGITYRKFNFNFPTDDVT